MSKAVASRVWQHFDVNERSANLAVCRYCGKSISRGGSASQMTGNNTTNLWTHLRYKHSDEVLVNPVRPRKRPNKLKANKRNVIKPKAKIKRRSVEMSKAKLEAAQANESGNLSPKWKPYANSQEIIDDIRSIIYIESPLYYSPIHTAELDDSEENVDRIAAPAMSSNLVAGTAISSATKAKSSKLETVLEYLSTITNQMRHMIQISVDAQNNDDDYYFALSLVPTMRGLSLDRKLYVRSKIQEILVMETEAHIRLGW